MAHDIVTIHCYNSTERMTRKAAMAKYLEGMVACEGSERDRYTNIYCKLADGYVECDDSWDFNNERNHK